MSQRDDIRAERNEINNRAQTLGINMDGERSKTDSDARTLLVEAVKLINDSTPRTTRVIMTTDDPPATGAFDGVNTVFGLTSSCLGDQIVVIWGSTAANTTNPLVKTRNPSPGNLEFYFDPVNPQAIVVGNPPLAGDRLIIVYRVER